MVHPTKWAPATPQMVEDYRRALRPGGRAQLGHVAIEGWRVVERALRSGATPSVVLVTAAFSAGDDTRQAKLVATLSDIAEVTGGTVDDATMRALVAGRSFGDIVALVPLPAPFDLAAWAQRADTADGGLLVLVGVVDPGNIGALVRTALATGIAGVLVIGGADPFHPKALRTSMGALFRVPVVRLDPGTPDTPIAPHADVDPWQMLGDLGVRTVGTTTDGGLAPWHAPLTGRVAIVVGGEAHGLSADDSERLDTCVTIPMAQRVDSFSVSAAAAILLYERSRQLADRP